MYYKKFVYSIRQKLETI